MEEQQAVFGGLGKRTVWSASTGDGVSLQPLCLLLGRRLNADEDLTYLDVSVVFPRWQEAVALAATYNQIAVYDLAHEAEVLIGGTGDEPLDIPSESERLPPLRRIREDEGDDTS